MFYFLFNSVFLSAWAACAAAKPVHLGFTLGKEEIHGVENRGRHQHVKLQETSLGLEWVRVGLFALLQDAYSFDLVQEGQSRGSKGKIKQGGSETAWGRAAALLSWADLSRYPVNGAELIGGFGHGCRRRSDRGEKLELGHA